MVTALILAPVIIALVALSLPGLRRDSRTAVVVPEPERIATVAPYVVTDLPDRDERQAFAYDYGFAVEDPEQDDS